MPSVLVVPITHLMTLILQRHLPLVRPWRRQPQLCRITFSINTVMQCSLMKRTVESPALIVTWSLPRSKCRRFKRNRVSFQVRALMTNSFKAHCLGCNNISVRLVRLTLRIALRRRDFHSRHGQRRHPIPLSWRRSASPVTTRTPPPLIVRPWRAK